MRISIMSTDYPHLFWALNRNGNLLSEIIDYFGQKKEYLESLDKLVYDLIHLRCENIQEKFCDVDNLNKFLSTIEEFEIARILGFHGNKIVLLPDDYFKKKSPDIFCSKNSMNAYIEVMHVSDSEASFILIDRLRQYLRSYPCRIDVHIKKEIAMPQMKKVERIACLEKLNSSWHDFQKEFQKCNFDACPLTIETKHATFKISRSGSEKGYPGIFSTDVISIPSEELREYIKPIIIQKAEKRNRFFGEHRTFYYILAFACDETSIDEHDMDLLLYGKIPKICAFTETQEVGKEQLWQSILDDKESQIPYWKIIDKASNSGWKDFLLNKKLLPNDYSYLSEAGIYLTETAMRNVSGILFKSRTDRISFYPNPFCKREINNPNIESFLFTTSH